MSRNEWEAWQAEAPPPGFAERVVRRAQQERSAPPSRGRRIAAGVMLAAAAAAALAFGAHLRRAQAKGDVTASERREVRIGTRAIAVLEKGAHVAWDGDAVTQAAGDVFWRVEPGARLAVHTPAGEVTVKGTCFRVKLGEDEMTRRDIASGAVGAAIGIAAFVGVYEGKVAVSAKAASVDVAAGEGAEIGSAGLRKTSSASPGEAAGGAAESDPLLAANQNLADTVQAYKRRLEAIGTEKDTLQKKLAVAEAQLARIDGGSAAAHKSDYDLSQDDWKTLAKEGTVKSRVPCAVNGGFSYSPASLNRLGLAPQDGPIVAKALATSNKRTWAVIKPLCSQALGGAPDVADRVGQTACVNLILDLERQKNSDAVDELTRQVAEIRAGERPMPGANDPIDPAERVLLALTGESPAIEADLAQSLGPADANRVVFGEEGCWSNMSSGVGPRPVQ